MSDIQDGLINALWTRITTDGTHVTLMGGTPRLYHVWAIPDAEFPYLVHRLELRSPGNHNIEPEGTYLIDLWTYSPNAQSALNIKARIMALLDNYKSTTAQTTDWRLWWQTDTFVPESTPQIWHLAMQFNVKYLKDADVGVTLYR